VSAISLAVRRSFSSIASATKSRSGRPCRAASALAFRMSGSGRSKVVFTENRIYGFTVDVN